MGRRGRERAPRWRRGGTWGAIGALAGIGATLALVAPGHAAGDPDAAPDGPARPIELEVEVAGLVRRALVVTPPVHSPHPGRRPPILVVLHGVGGRGADLRSLGFEELAAGQGVVVAYPDAWRGSWNDGRPGLDPASAADATDDVAFVGALVRELGDAVGADTSRVAVAGFSNGALMTGRLACESPDGLVAVALVAGTVGQGFETGCRPSRPLPVMVVAGTGDGIVPYDGGRIADFAGRARGRVAAVDDFLAFWSAAGRCGAPTSAVVPAAIAVSRVDAGGCAPGAALRHYRVEGGGHEWYRVGGFDTTGAIWEFVAPWLEGTGHGGRS